MDWSSGLAACRGLGPYAAEVVPGRELLDGLDLHGQPVELAGDPRFEAREVGVSMGK